jgi:quinolinate synthase
VRLLCWQLPIISEVLPALLKFTQKDEAQEFIVVTETGILHQMQKNNPNKTFIPAPPNNSCACNDCPHMKLNTLEKLYSAWNMNYPNHYG